MKNVVQVYLLNSCPEGVPLELVEVVVQEINVQLSLALLDLSLGYGQGKVVRVASLDVALQKVVCKEAHRWGERRKKEKAIGPHPGLQDGRNLNNG